MTAPSDRPSPVIRFIDALFQEQNIRWLLALGSSILLCSSIMFVSTHWNTYPPLWKYGVLLGYTAFFHAAGQIGYHRLGLRRTGTGLMAITVLLIPLSFAAFRWFYPANTLSLEGLLPLTGLFILLAGNVFFAYHASKRIFDHFLLRSQPTFLASYLILSCSAAVFPLLPQFLAPLLAFLTWCVFTVGTIKVNRHAFWLTEEYRKPRIFGFFPILLLGTQFLSLFSIILFPQIELAWTGFGVVLTAIPILLAADSLAGVLQTRSQSETPVYSASVMSTLIVGVAVVIGGTALASYGFPGTVAIVPTALLAAGIFGVTAHRTRHPVFTWLTLIMGLIAYQTSPVFFKEVTRALLSQAATAIGESRMPIAFYGLTYLPLLAATTLVSRRLGQSKDPHITQPLCQFSIGLPLLLLPLGLTHAKAALPVSLALGGLMAWQTWLFRMPRLQWGVVAAYLSATVGLIAYLTQVAGIPDTLQLDLLVWSIAGGLLTVPGHLWDRLIKKLSTDLGQQSTPVAQRTSQVILIGAAGLSLIHSVLTANSLPASSLICIGFLIFQSFQLQHAWVSAIPVLLTYSLTLTQAHNWGFTEVQLLFISTLWLVTFSLLTRLLERSPESSVTRTFGTATSTVCTIGLVLTQAFLILALVVNIAPFGLIPELWSTAALTLVGSLELAVRRRSVSLTVMSWVLALLEVSSIASCLLLEISDLRWLPVIWTLFSTATAVILRYSVPLSETTDSDIAKLVKTVQRCITVTLAVVIVLGLPFFDTSLRIASFIAITGLFLQRFRTSQTPILRDLLPGLVNVQILSVVVQLCCPTANHLFNLSIDQLGLITIPVSFVAALSAVFWEVVYKPSAPRQFSISFGMQLISMIGLFLQLLIAGHTHVFLTGAAVLVICGILSSLQFRNGFHKVQLHPDGTLSQAGSTQATRHVWFGLGIIGIGFLELVVLGILPGGTLTSLFGPLVASLFMSIAATASAGSGRWELFRRPLQQTATVLPSLTVLGGLGQQMFSTQIHWPGLNSLALLLSAGFYFWKGLEEKRNGMVVTSAIILNIALAILWTDLQWSDPQLFLVPVGISILTLVECLRQQIPQKLQNPLRYAGALTILVSPTFEIVSGSWIHLVVLMITSLIVVIVAMGLRVKALMYTGTAFLIADLITILVRGSIDHPNRLWLAGIVIGGAVIGLAAYCERHREQMQQRIRIMAAKLETWH